eukprot:scaffold6843_cov149-Isochrysis_galbana.AAC.1
MTRVEYRARLVAGCRVGGRSRSPAPTTRPSVSWSTQAAGAVAAATARYRLVSGAAARGHFAAAHLAACCLSLSLVLPCSHWGTSSSTPICVIQRCIEGQTPDSFRSSWCEDGVLGCGDQCADGAHSAHEVWIILIKYISDMSKRTPAICILEPCVGPLAVRGAVLFHLHKTPLRMWPSRHFDGKTHLDRTASTISSFSLTPRPQCSLKRVCQCPTKGGNVVARQLAQNHSITLLLIVQEKSVSLARIGQSSCAVDTAVAHSAHCSDTQHCWHHPLWQPPSAGGVLSMLTCGRRYSRRCGRRYC